MLALGLKEIFVFKMIRLLETLIALNGLMDFVWDVLLEHFSIQLDYAKLPILFVKHLAK